MGAIRSLSHPLADNAQFLKHRRCVGFSNLGSNLGIQPAGPDFRHHLTDVVQGPVCLVMKLHLLRVLIHHGRRVFREVLGNRDYGIVLPVVEAVVGLLLGHNLPLHLVVLPQLVNRLLTNRHLLSLVLHRYVPVDDRNRQVLGTPVRIPNRFQEEDTVQKR